MSNKYTFEGFSISHAAILQSTGAEEVAGDVYAVREGTIAVDTGNYDNTGDDVVLSSWFWFNYATVTVSAGFVPFPLIALLSGTTVTSSGTGDAEAFAIPLWAVKSMNTPTRGMLIRVPSKDGLGKTRVMDFILYKVQFQPFSFDGPSYKNGLVLNYAGRALVSSVDEKGTSLGAGNDAIGRIVNKQTAASGSI